VLEHQCETGIVEMWADIAGYEGRYQVSNCGRIKSLARTRKGKSDCLVPVAEKIMKVHIKKDNGRQRPYAEICLRNGGSREIAGKQKLVHRLVADAFIKKLGIPYILIYPKSLSQAKKYQFEYISNAKHGNFNAQFNRNIPKETPKEPEIKKDPLTTAYLEKRNEPSYVIYI
jgi:hypothetical protein